MDETIQKLNRRKNKLNRLFVGSIVFIELMLLLIIAYSIFRTFTDEISIFSVIALSLMLLWIGLIIGFLAWATYFYNINLGLTNESWKEIKRRQQRAEDLKAAGEDPGKVPEIPEDNPYSTQSLGLPPGTVRATLTLTLMVGAISLFIYSMGNSQIDEGDSFIYDNFEFFKTAFLMMIAFYFGSRSLEVLQRKSGIITKRFGKVEGSSSIPGGTSSSAADEMSLAPDLPDFPGGPSKPGEKKGPDLGKLETGLATRPLTGTESDDTSEPVKRDYTTKTLSREQIKELAQTYSIEAAAMMAVTEVESGKSGFLSDGRPRILFEGHKFWKHIRDKYENGKLDFG
ncbi:MAG: N-acetylmuramidase domain-containing protein, partial [Bacteroidota bacterium]